MKKQLLCTLGPASMNDFVIPRLEEFGVSMFRINLSHTPLADVAANIRFIRQRSKVPVCLDTEGAQIRTGNFVTAKFPVRENSLIRIHRRRVPGDSRDINFYPLDIIDKFQVGDFISIDFNAVLVQVVDTDDAGVTARVLTGGEIGRNKAVTVEAEIAMAPLTEKDKAALQIGVGEGVRDYALSFANRASDVAEIRRIVGDANVISKIECRNGLRNLSEIMALSDAILIDRGDLSREIPLERIPIVQKQILQSARDAGVKAYVATNLLESMVADPAPTRAEINDIFNTLEDGADGLVLAAETAIGKYPIRCAAMVVKMLNAYENRDQVSEPGFVQEGVSLLTPPHGGRLVIQEAEASDLTDIDVLPRLRINDLSLIDCEQIAIGAYSPLTGFMDREAIEAVLNTNRLPDGNVWTMPVFLQITRERADAFGIGDRVGLIDGEDKLRSLLDVSAIFDFDPEQLARGLFGTASTDHPGAARLLAGGNRFVAGKVAMVARAPSRYRHYELTPAQTRFVFTQKGWSRVVGLKTAAPALKADEFVHLAALQTTKADGLYISPMIGPMDSALFSPEEVMKSYQMLIEFGVYPENRVALGSVPAYHRHGGLREILFTALCRKNLGCSHFVVSGEISADGNLLSRIEVERYFDEIGRLGEIGIQPVVFESVVHDEGSGQLREGGGSANLLIQGGQLLADALKNQDDIPGWLVHDVVYDAISRRPVRC